MSPSLYVRLSPSANADADADAGAEAGADVDVGDECSCGLPLLRRSASFMHAHASTPLPWVLSAGALAAMLAAAQPCRVQCTAFRIRRCGF